MSRTLKTPPPIVFILLGLLVWSGYKIYPKFPKFFSSESPTPEVVESTNSPVADNSISNRISWGERLSIDTPNELKQKGIIAFQQQNYQQAIDYWQQSLAQFPNDPETVIYLNNAAIGDSKSYSIVVSVPIGADVNTAQEILRGVAQAQKEINAGDGIKGIPLKVAIANDDNDPQIARQLAQSFAENPDILGVVGHFSSDVTLAAAEVYEQAGLVAISPTSTSVSISQVGDYIFRTVPSDRFAGNALAKYFLEQLGKQKAVVFYDSASNYSNSLKDSFATDLVSNGGEVVTEFDLRDPDFEPTEAVIEAKNRDAEALTLLATSSTLNLALSVARANNHHLPLLAGDDVYTAKTLKTAGKDTVDMVVAIPWHIRGEVNPDFPQAASNLWKGEVNWRTALAYDATIALIAGIKDNPTRQGIQEALSRSQFSSIGASGEIRFLPSGDRNLQLQLVRVQSGQNSGFGYDFVPLD
ncbi:MAG: ABC transporter substrate-binding protein [Pleurocapsa sp. MO_226.B13]|nr:ABC transporter substrate-binding protein [Pleurocapsa sp. MO_226.B13]